MVKLEAGIPSNGFTVAVDGKKSGGISIQIS